MSQPVRVGIVGAGANTRSRHIPGFQAIAGVTVVAVANRSRASGERAAREAGIPRVSEDWREIVTAPDIDAVCIGTWPNLHAEVTLAALRAGKHVLTEARMARTLAEAREMLAESRRHPRLVTQIVPAPMSLPFDATVVRLLQSDVLGTLREVVFAATTDTLADSCLPLSWRQDQTLNGRNALQLGIYYETVLRWLGRGVDRVCADAAIFTPERRSEEGRPKRTSVPESLTVLGTYADGARLIAHCSGVETSGSRSEFRLNGSVGGLRLDLARGELWLARLGGREQRVEIPSEQQVGWRVEADFIDSIRNGTPVRLTDFQTGVAYMQFTEAVWESWNNAGRRVTY